MAERKQAQFRIHIGDCRESMKLYPANHFDSIVCDPPYDLTAGKKGASGVASENDSTPYGRSRIGVGNGAGGFMGQKWDSTGVAFEAATWREAMRVLKPGGYLLAFGGTRTYHRMVCAIEDAGFEIRDFIAWIYGQGFPKSLDASKALDAHFGHEREVTREATAELRSGEVIGFDQRGSDERERRDIPVSDEAKQWDGWGTALKPAIEPICFGRKPLIGTVAENLIEHGTGAINIDGCRVGWAYEGEAADTDAKTRPNSRANGREQGEAIGPVGGAVNTNERGRWPANVIHDGSTEVLAAFPNTVSGYSDGTKGGVQQPRGRGGIWSPSDGTPCGPQYGDTGSAARFFYGAKASMQDREEGLEHMPLVRRTDGRSTEHEVPNLRTSERRNFHPTVKPTDLMRYLVRLVTSKGGLCLDPFMGSGSTGKACMFEGVRFVGMDLTEDYEPIARARITWALRTAFNQNPFGF